MVDIYQSFVYSSNYTVHQLKGPEFATLEMPPNHKLFDSATAEQLGKKSLLLEWRDQLEQSKGKLVDTQTPPSANAQTTPANAQAGPTNTPVSVNLNFGELLHTLQGRPQEQLAVQPPVTPATHPIFTAEPMLLSAAQQSNLGPCLSLADFCHTYSLSDELQTKLQSNGFTSSHALRFVSLDDIKAIGLLCGEVAQLWDAVSEWCGA